MILLHDVIIQRGFIPLIIIAFITGVVRHTPVVRRKHVYIYKEEEPLETGNRRFSKHLAPSSHKTLSSNSENGGSSQSVLRSHPVSIARLSRRLAYCILASRNYLPATMSPVGEFHNDIQTSAKIPYPYNQYVLPKKNVHPSNDGLPLNPRHNDPH